MKTAVFSGTTRSQKVGGDGAIFCRTFGGHVSPENAVRAAFEFHRLTASDMALPHPEQVVAEVISNGISTVKMDKYSIAFGCEVTLLRDGKIVDYVTSTQDDWVATVAAVTVSGN
jgi:hypothetical protein